MNSDKFIQRSTDISLRSASAIAGIGLLLMTIIAPVVEFNVFKSLVVPGNAESTVNNILNSIDVFRIGISLFLFVAILDIIVAWALYVLLRPTNKSISLLAGWFRIIYAAILALALNNLFNILQLLSGTNNIILATDQLYVQVMLFFSAFRSGWNIGLAIFGIHLLLLGYLIVKSGYIPKWLGVLVAISGLGYTADSFISFLIPTCDIKISIYTFIGEVLLMFWLLWKGIRGFDKKLVERIQEN